MPASSATPSVVSAQRSSSRKCRGAVSATGRLVCRGVCAKRLIIRPGARCGEHRYIIAALLIVTDRLRRRFAQFKLVADFLQPRSKRFDLLLLVPRSRLEVLLLLRDDRFLLCNSGL